jgi:hypothetical protein
MNLKDKLAETLLNSFEELLNEAKGSKDTAKKAAARKAKKEHKAKKAAERNKASGPALTALIGDKPMSNRERSKLLRKSLGDTKSGRYLDKTNWRRTASPLKPDTEDSDL